MLYETLSQHAILGSLSVRARTALTLAPTRYETPQNRTPSTSFVFRGRLKNQSGFTLVEMIVSVGLFAVVMLVAVGALLSLTGANRKAQALQSVMNNLNVGLDGMVRSIRMGSGYHCGTGPINISQDCTASGGTVFAFEPFHSGVQPVPPWIYEFRRDANGVGRIWKSEDGTQQGEVPITAPEVSIENMKFYVIGTTRGDTVQPKTVITVSGIAGASDVKTSTTFSIQATAVQRLLDL